MTKTDKLVKQLKKARRVKIVTDNGIELWGYMLLEATIHGTRTNPAMGHLNPPWDSAPDSATYALA